MAWLPNALTVLRLALTPAIFIAIVQGRWWLALGLLVVAGGSDWLDGVLARRFGWQTRLGSLLDPVADKLLFLAVFLALVGAGLMPLWLAGLAIARDAIIVAGATFYNFHVEKLTGSATWLGKFNTLVQGAYACTVLAQEALDRDAPLFIAAITLILVMSIVASGAHYIAIGLGRVRRRKNDD